MKILNYYKNENNDFGFNIYHVSGVWVSQLTTDSPKDTSRRNATNQICENS